MTDLEALYQDCWSCVRRTGIVLYYKINPMDKLQKYLKNNKQTIVYFYPRDNTPGCTIEAHDFSLHKETFNKN